MSHLLGQLESSYYIIFLTELYPRINIFKMKNENENVTCVNGQSNVACRGPKSPTLPPGRQDPILFFLAFLF